MHYTELKHMPERSQTYLGSPCLLRLDDETLIATHDYFGNMKHPSGEAGLTSVYHSYDNGQSWENITHIIGAFWGVLFLNKGVLYHLSSAQEYGDIVIRKSPDKGFTWSVPTDEKHGVILRSGPGRTFPNYGLNAPTAVCFHKGRIYKSCENIDFNPGEEYLWRPNRFLAAVLSAPDDADLLNAASWTLSNQVPFDSRKLPDEKLHHPHSGWLEGNVVEAPDGTLRSLMRIHLPEYNKAAMLRLSDDGRTLSFDYNTGIIDFIGGHSKFTLRRDPATGWYFVLTNYTEKEPFANRSILKLAASKDLLRWFDLGVVLRDESGLEPEMSGMLTGFQYVDWQFNGDDIIYLSRTAYLGAHNYHDSNRITFHVIRNFRKRLDRSAG